LVGRIIEGTRIAVLEKSKKEAGRSMLIGLRINE
jgi:hypothetical protein